MFDAASRQLLEEQLGYERFVLNACASAVQKSKGQSSEVEIVINDVPPHSLHIGITDYVGSHHGAAIVQEISALIFTAAYKVIDMIAEWVIAENQGNCPWPFSDKLAVLDGNAPLQFPGFLSQDARLRTMVVELYRNLQQYRNAITHGEWGKNNDGNLQFNFTRNNRHFALSVPFETVLNFGRAMALTAELLVDPILQSQERLNSLRFLFDRLAALHQQQPFAVLEPRHYRVIRRVTTSTRPLTIDLDAIRKQVAFRSGDHPSTFDLRIELRSELQPETWEIPHPSIPTFAKLILDSNWDRFHTG